jgi:hypothetical protein
MALGYYERPAPSFGGAPVAWMQLLPGSPQAPGPVDMILGFDFTGCAQPMEMQFVLNQTVPSPDSFGVEGVLSSALSAAPPARGSETELVATVHQPGVSTGLPRTFPQLHLTPAGFGSCYLRLPSADGPWTAASISDDGFPPRAVVLRGTQTDVSGSGNVTVVDGNGPTGPQDPHYHVWKCSSVGSSDCSAVIMFTEPWHDTVQSVVLLIATAMAAGALASASRAAVASRSGADSGLGRAVPTTATYRPGPGVSACCCGGPCDRFRWRTGSRWRDRIGDQGVVSASSEGRALGHERALRRCAQVRETAVGIGQSSHALPWATNDIAPRGAVIALALTTAASRSKRQRAVHWSRDCVPEFVCCSGTPAELSLRPLGRPQQFCLARI